MPCVDITIRSNGKEINTTNCVLKHLDPKTGLESDLDIDQIMRYAKGYIINNYMFLPLVIKMCYQIEVDVKKKCVYVDTLHYLKDDKNLDLLIKIIMKYFVRTINCIIDNIGSFRQSKYLFVGYENGKVVSAYIPPYFGPSLEFFNSYMESDDKSTPSLLKQNQFEWAKRLNTAPVDIIKTISKGKSNKTADVISSFNADLAFIPFKAFNILIHEHKVEKDHPFYQACHNAICNTVAEYFRNVFARGYLEKDNNKPEGAL